MKPSELLRKAAARIEKGWTQGTLARSFQGAPVWISEGTADRWCATGSLIVESKVPAEQLFSEKGRDFQEACDQLRRTIGNSSIESWNDRHGRTSCEVSNAMEVAADMYDVNNS